MTKKITFFIAVIVASLIFATIASAEGYRSPQLSALASKYAHRDVDVMCVNDLEQGTEGEVWFSWAYNESGEILPPIASNTELINAPNCGWLEHAINYPSLSKRGKRYFLANAEMVGQAMLVVIHESTHILLQSTDEGLVECVAMKNTFPYLKALGFNRALTSIFWDGAKQFHGFTPDEYHTHC